jgi:RsiW-degrading membrane proteinase PrsW (M82 family)
MTTQTNPAAALDWRRIFAWGLVLWIAATAALAITEDLILLPSVVLIGSFLVPVTVIFWFADHEGRSELNVRTMLRAFFVAGVLGLIAAAALETWLLPSRLVPNLWVGLIEEAVKGIGIVALSGGLRRYDLRDGLLLGTTVGLGFGAFESAGYTLRFGFVDGQLSLGDLISEELLREVIAPFCHGIWSGLLGAAIFHSRRRPTLLVAATYLGVSVLHAIWDMSSNAAVLVTVLVAGDAAERDALSLRNIPAPGDVTPEWMVGTVQWVLMIVIALIGVVLVRRVWTRPPAPA